MLQTDTSSAGGNTTDKGRRKISIGLLWHSTNSENLGVGALTLANIHLLNKAAAAAGVDIEYTVIGYIGEPENYPSLPPVKTYPITGKDVKFPLDYIKQIRKCDMVIDIGAGDSFTDIYTLKRFIFLTLTKFWVRVMGRPLILAPQTVGPFTSTWKRTIANWLIASSKITFIRDEMSRVDIRTKSAQKKLIKTADVAFYLPRQESPKAEGKTRVGINISGLLYHGGLSGETNQFGLTINYKEFIDTIIDHFASLPDTEVILIPHVLDNASIDGDTSVNRKIAEEKNLPTPPDFKDPSEAKTYISGLDFFTGSRMHACIAAISSGVPTVPVAYSRKFEGLLGALGYQWTVDGKAATTQEAIDGVIAGFDNRAKLSEDAKAATSNAQSQLDDYVAKMTEEFRELVS